MKADVIVNTANPRSLIGRGSDSAVTRSAGEEQLLAERKKIAFSPSSRFDLIVTYFITNRIYDVFEINAALFKYGRPTLGD